LFLFYMLESDEIHMVARIKKEHDNPRVKPSNIVPTTVLVPVESNSKPTKEYQWQPPETSEEWFEDNEVAQKWGSVKR
jgi:hypothetical protein